jgi:hypothetical protein
VHGNSPSKSDPDLICPRVGLPRASAGDSTDHQTRTQVILPWPSAVS